MSETSTTPHADIERPYYAILGVTRDSSPSEIRAAYRDRVRVMHPDAGGDAEEFIKLNEAYNTLRDPVRRKHYDLSGESGEWHPTKFQEAVITSLATAFDETVSDLVKQGIPVEGIDFMRGFKAIIVAGAEEIEKRYHAVQAEIRALEKLRKRIKRRGEEKNLFAEIIDMKLKEKGVEYTTKRKDLDVTRRVLEEVMFYDDVSDVVRTMQAARYPGEASDFFKEANIVS